MARDLAPLRPTSHRALCMSAWRTCPTPGGEVWMARAWDVASVRRSVDWLLDRTRLPPVGAHVFLKPNLISDLPALVGNSTDLRLLVALIGALKTRGFHRISLGDGSNVGVHRRRISAARRLAVERLCEREGVSWVDLNESAWRMAPIGGRWG